MKKYLLFLFILFLPLKVNALSISSLEISSPSEIKQWEFSEIIVDIKISRDSSEGLSIGLGAGIEVQYDKNALTIEGATAKNSEIYTQGSQGNREIIGVFDFEGNDISFKTECSNNIYCNSFRFVLQIYPRSSGQIDFTARLPYLLIGDISKMPDFTEDDIYYVDGSFEKKITLNVIASPKPVEATEPIEITERTTTAITAPKISKITTTKTKTTVNSTQSSSSTSSTTSSTTLTEKEKNKEKEKNNLMFFKNRKVYLYGGIVIGVILIIIIIKIIIIKIRDRKIDKVLKGL